MTWLLLTVLGFFRQQLGAKYRENINIKLTPDFKIQVYGIWYMVWYMVYGVQLWLLCLFLPEWKVLPSPSLWNGFLQAMVTCGNGDTKLEKLQVSFPVPKSQLEGQILKICICSMWKFFFFLQCWYLKLCCFLPSFVIFYLNFCNIYNCWQSHSVKIKITNFHVLPAPYPSWVLFHEHVDFQLKISLPYPLSNQSLDLIHFTKYLLRVYYVSHKMMGRNPVSELSLKRSLLIYLES